MKKFSSLAIISFLIFIMVGCSSPSPENGDSNVSIDDMLNDIKEQVAEDMKANGAGEEVYVDGELQGYMEGDLVETDESDPFVSIYMEKMELNKEELKNGYVLAPMMNINSDEIFLLEAKDEAQVESLKAALEREKVAQVQIWEQYLPDQYEKVENNIIKTNGKFLLYVTYENPEKIESIFDGFFE
ncbi:MAG: DUF4358 domain-containing protein [Bacillota bacterium]